MYFDSRVNRISCQVRCFVSNDSTEEAKIFGQCDGNNRIPWILLTGSQEDDTLTMATTIIVSTIYRPLAFFAPG